jgi:hypothetical protein
MALLVAALRVLALHRIAAVMAGTVAWWPPRAPPSTAQSELGHHRHGVAVIGSFGAKDNVSAHRPCIRDRSGGRRYAGDGFAQPVSARTSGQISGRVVIVGVFDTIWPSWELYTEKPSVQWPCFAQGCN